MNCPWCGAAGSGAERTCRQCSRMLPLLMFDQEAPRDLAYEGEGQEARFAAGMHSLSVEGAVKQMAASFLEGGLDNDAYLDQLDRLEGKLQTILEQMRRGLAQGAMALRSAPRDDQELFEEFRGQAGDTLDALERSFTEVVDALAELEKTEDAAWVETAVARARAGMELVEEFESLCAELRSDLAATE